MFGTERFYRRYKVEVDDGDQLEIAMKMIFIMLMMKTGEGCNDDCNDEEDDLCIR